MLGTCESGWSGENVATVPSSRRVGVAAGDGTADGTTVREGDGATEPDGVSSSAPALNANSAACSAACEECTTCISSHKGMNSMPTVTISSRTVINSVQTDINSSRTVAHLGSGAVELIPAFGRLGGLGGSLDLRIFLG